MSGQDIIVLFEGFSEDKIVNGQEVMLANCTCTLIKSSGLNIIVDTLTPWDSERLLSALRDHNVLPEDVNYVVCTHGHSDHVGCNHLFPNVEKLIVGRNISRRETYFLHNWDTPFIINENVEVVATPGHTRECVSVIVKGCHVGELGGTVGITGDLFEKEGDIFNDSLWRDAGSFNEDVQRVTRSRIASQVDVIIPGHGAPFRMTREMREELERQSHNNSSP
ncbi:Metallo-beta-lactamase domain-containing protein 1 [Sergentomyia squamirostris]